ncbi:MAG: hypothetical protein ACI4SG_03850 [Oligosphaeraceae bacterium]
MSALQNNKKGGEGSWLALRWKEWMHKLQMLDIWRMMVAFGLAVATAVLIRQQSATSAYAGWQSVGPVPVQVPQNLGNEVRVLEGNYAVTLQVSVDVFHMDNSLSPREFKVSMDPLRLGSLIRQAGPGSGIRQVEYEVQPADVLEKPAGVDIREIRGAVLQVRYEPVVNREIPVHLTLDRRRQQEGWTYDCRPLQGVVVVRGPDSEVAGIASIATEPVVLQDTRAYTGMVRLQRPGNGEWIQLSRSEVEYEVRPEQNTMDKIVRAFTEIQVVFLARGESFLHPRLANGESPRVSVYLSGPSMVLKSLSTEQFRVVCDLTPYTLPGGQKVRLQVLGLPEGVQVTEILPQSTLSLELYDVREPLLPGMAPSGPAEGTP